MWVTLLLFSVHLGPCFSILFESI